MVAWWLGGPVACHNESGLLCTTLLRKVTLPSWPVSLQASSLLSFLSLLCVLEQGVTLCSHHMSSGSGNQVPLLEGGLDKALELPQGTAVFSHVLCKGLIGALVGNLQIDIICIAALPC